MQRVKEELALSIIFVGKWMALGLGSLGLIYLGIALAYNKSYLEPQLSQIDLQMELISEEVGDNQIIINQQRAQLSEIQLQKENLESDLKDRISDVETAESSLEELNPNWLDRINLPLRERDANISAAYEILEAAQLEVEIATNSIAQLVDQQTELTKEISELEEANQKHAEEIESLILTRRETEIGGRGPILWLFGVLFAT